MVLLRGTAADAVDTVKDACTAALYARDVGGVGGQLIEISLLESGQSFLWPHAMKGNTFFDAKNDMRSIGGHRFGWQVQHTGFTRDANSGYGATERKIDKKTGRMVYGASEDVRFVCLSLGLHLLPLMRSSMRLQQDPTVANSCLCHFF